MSEVVVSDISMNRLPDGPRDVFVSYSREDKAFVNELVSALEDADLSIWIDRDMKPSMDWWEEIKEGIEEANTVIFVASTHSFGSPVCNLEYAYARRLGKKVIGLLYENPQYDNARKNTQERALKDIVVPQILEKDFASKLIVDIFDDNCVTFNRENYIGIGSGSGFAASVEKILAAYEEDLAHVEEHTRLLARALQWQAADKASGYLLRGESLQAAQTWLQQGGAKKPAPTPLHQEYIQQSRSAELRRQRTTQAALAVGLLITSILAIVAWAARTEAVANEREAIVQRNEAQRVAQTFAMVDNTLKQNVGAQPSDIVRVGLDLWLTSREDNTLWQLAADTGAPRRDPVPVGTRPTAPVSDGQFLWLSNTGDTTVMRVIPANPTEMLTIEVGNNPSLPVVGGAWVWVISGTAFDQTLTQLEAASGAVVRAVDLGRHAQKVDFAGGAAWVSIDDNREPKVMRIDPITGETRSFPTERNASPPVVANDTIWLVNGRPGPLVALDPNTLSVLGTYPIGEQLTGPIFDGEWLWLRDSEAGEIIQFDVTSKQVVRRLRAQSSRDPFRHGDRLWVFGSDQLLSFDVRSGRLVTATDLRGNFGTPVIAGENLWLSNADADILIVVRLTDGALLRTLPNCDGPGVPTFDGINNWVSCVNENSVARIPATISYYGIRLEDSIPILQTLPACNNSGKPLFDGANLWVSCADDHSVVRIPATLSYYGLNPFTRDTEPTTPIYTSSNDRENLWIVQQAAGELVQFDAASGLVLTTIPIGDDPLVPVYDSVRYIWVAAQGGQVRRIDTHNPDDVRLLRIDIPEVTTISLAEGSVWVTGMSSNFADIDADDLVMIDPETVQIRKTHEFGIGSSGITYDDEYHVVWVSGATINKGTTYRLDARTGQILGESPVGLVSYEPTLHEDSAWVASLYPEDIGDVLSAVVSSNTGALYRLDRATGERLQMIDLDELPSKPIVVDGRIWLTQGSFEVETTPGISLLGGNTDPGRPRGIVAIDPESGDILKSWSPCRNVGIPFWSGHFIWGICIGFDESESDDSGTVIAIDPTSLEVAHEYRGLGRFPWPAMSFGESVWVIFQETGNAAVFDATTGALTRVIGLGDGPSKPVDDGHGYLWVSNGDDGTVQRITTRLSE